MFGLITLTLKAALSVVDIPVSMVADVITLGGVLNDKDTIYTGDAASRLIDNVSNITKSK